MQRLFCAPRRWLQLRPARMAATLATNAGGVAPVAGRVVRGIVFGKMCHCCKQCTHSYGNHMLHMPPTIPGSSSHTTTSCR